MTSLAPGPSPKSNIDLFNTNKSAYTGPSPSIPALALWKSGTNGSTAVMHLSIGYDNKLYITAADSGGGHTTCSAYNASNGNDYNFSATYGNIGGAPLIDTNDNIIFTNSNGYIISYFLQNTGPDAFSLVENYNISSGGSAFYYGQPTIDSSKQVIYFTGYTPNDANKAVSLFGFSIAHSTPSQIPNSPWYLGSGGSPNNYGAFHTPCLGPDGSVYVALGTKIFKLSSDGLSHFDLNTSPYNYTPEQVVFGAISPIYDSSTNIVYVASTSILGSSPCIFGFNAVNLTLVWNNTVTIPSGGGSLAISNVSGMALGTYGGNSSLYVTGQVNVGFGYSILIKLDTTIPASSTNWKWEQTFNDYISPVVLGADNTLYIGTRSGLVTSIIDLGGSFIANTIFTSDTGGDFSNIAPVIGAYNNLYVIATGGGDNKIYSIGQLPSTGPICFGKGTLISTKRGDVPIEDLTSDDEVFTVGPIRESKLVTKQGFSRVKRILHFTKDTLDQYSRPIIFKKDSLATNVPNKDTVLSPLHSVLLNGVDIVQAHNLINHTTIYYDTVQTSIEYYHILLDTHSIIMSNNIATESLDLSVKDEVRDSMIIPIETTTLLKNSD